MASNLAALRLRVESFVLQHRGLTIARHFGAPAWLSTRAAKARIEAFWATAEPLNGWLDRNVGPSEEPQSQEGRR